MPEKDEKTGLEVPTAMDWDAMHRTAAFLEKSKMAEYVAVMSDPWKSVKLNFLAGVARGVGMVIGATVLGGLVILLLLSGLKQAFHHAGGVPWIGAEMKNAIGFVLQAVDEHKQKDGQ